MPGLTVVIPTCERNGLLRRTLESVAKCNFPTAYRRLLVIENGKQSGAEQVTREFTGAFGAEYHFCSQGNKSASLNHCLELVNDDWLVFLDDDIRADSRLLEAYYRAFRESGRRTFFAGPMSVDYECKPPDWLLPFLPRSARGWEWREGRPIDEAVAMGCNWAASAEVLRELGGFDTRLGPGGTTGGAGQEAEMQKRFLKCGMSGRFVSDARVWHYVPADRCSVGWTLRRGYRNGITRGVWNKGAGTRVWLGVPAWAVKTWCLKGVALIPSSLRGRDSFFSAGYDFAAETGRVVGFYRSRSQRTADDSRKTRAASKKKTAPRL